MTLRTYDIDTVRKHGTLLYRNTYKADSCSDSIAFVEDTSDTTTATELGIEVWSLVHDNGQQPTKLNLRGLETSPVD